MRYGEGGMSLLAKGFTLFSACRSRSYRFIKMSVHNVAETGFQKGSHYNANRPSYSEEAVALIASTISGIQTQDAVTYDVLELGAGTGLLTKKLSKKLGKTSRYLATEPSAGFLPVLQESCPDVETRMCAADSIPLADCATKVVVCAQSFHWFPYRHVLDEIRRVMVNGGKLILIWNKKDWSVPWVNEIQSYIMTQDDTRPVHNVGGYLAWREVFQDYTGFKDEEYVKLPGVEFKGNQDFVVDHISSISVLAGLTGERSRQALDAIRAILQKHPETRDNDSIQIPFSTEIYIYTCHKTD
ncbi:uncharacterized protein [Haliotis asinina]|uniref:uncharacterized protein isoform X2 n=1 Tax=Haliotis asinina TaxID=109174 RepID=UPI0035321314